MLTQQQSASFFTDILCFYYLNPSVSKKTMIENQYMNFIHSYLTTLSNDWHSVRYDLLFSLYMKGKNQEACECCFDLFYHLIHQHQINIQQIKKNMEIMTCSMMNLQFVYIVSPNNHDPRVMMNHSNLYINQSILYYYSR